MSTAAKTQRLATGRAIVRRGAKALADADSKRIKRADRAFVTAACNYRRSAKAYMRAVHDWQEFATRNTQDDAAHEEHHRRVIAARQTLNAADIAFVTASANPLVAAS